MTASDPSKMSHTPGVFFGFGLVLLGLALCQVFVNVDLHNVTQQSLQASKKAFTQGKYGPKIQSRLSQSNNDTDNNPPKYHLVFSTSCTDQQDWESFVFFYHAARVQQPGTVTRIVSGCDARQAREVLDFFHRHIAPLSVEGNFHVHLTPDYGKVALARGHYYKYMNKRACCCILVLKCCCCALINVSAFVVHSPHSILALSNTSHSLWTPTLDGTLVAH